jgi:multiple sugar transport system permease protein
MVEIAQPDRPVSTPAVLLWGSRAMALLSNERVFVIVTLFPAVILIGVYIFLPLFYSLYLSFFRTRLFEAAGFAGLDQYATLFTDEVFWIALINTLTYTAASVTFTLVLGLASALLLHRPLVGRDLFRTVMFIPYIIPYAAYALLWYWLFDPRYGLVNYLLSFIGVGAIPWLKSSHWVIPAFVLMSVWKRLGFAMVVFLAGLQTIPSELYDAAIMDGAGAWQKFRHITLPMLSPITLFIAVISLIYSLQLFVEPLVMTHGGPGDSSQSLSYLLYEQGYSYLNVGSASVNAVVLSALTFLLSLVLLRRFDIQEVYK